MKKYIVHLTEEQRQALKHLISSGVAPARKLRHAQILLRPIAAKWVQAGPMNRSSKRWR